jgi:thiol-disulfide isomerase/thioredoxin
VHTEKARPPADFTWQPEPDFVEIDLKAHEPMAVGTVVPDVELQLQGGGKTRLSQLLQDKKALLLDFWFVDCVPCRSAMPVVEEIANGLEGQGLALCGVDFGDPEERIARFLAESKHSLRVLRNGVGANDLVHVLGVPSFPCLFLLGPDRKVLWREAGFERTHLEAALRDAGLTLPGGR